MNAIIEFSRLYQQRPGPDTSAEVVAAWYRAKGRLHELLGATGGPDAAQEFAFAAASYEHARRLERSAGHGHSAAA
ncbi:hypothetical protein V1227_06540 [Lentzea sp. DG1S-22]|uniref:hypothetical protein n=1 Tax=Lentzea sp. DG1S-22 TaxID=3108822 RepID=UPI002E75A0EE|nr:hypothetical protein [Lentzea sp. DG1S-22]WVH82411.1 hypothetical protein V1227_06540 [Lentzea sp. DG1S-22]